MQKSAKFKNTFQASVAESLITDAWRPKVDVAMLPAVPQNARIWAVRSRQCCGHDEAAGLMTNEVAAEYNMLAVRAESGP